MLLSDAEELTRLTKLITNSDTISPCACCGVKLAWIFAGDGTTCREVFTGKDHKCSHNMNTAPKGTFRYLEREVKRLQKELEDK